MSARRVLGICPACAPHCGHAPGKCDEKCGCKIESRPGLSEFVVRTALKPITYFKKYASIGPMFGATKAAAFRFKTQEEVARTIGAWPATALVEVESVELSAAHAPQPFLKWAGGKRQLVPTLCDAITRIAPNGFQHYYEPFVGGGALFFALRATGWRGHATLGDSNERLVRTYLGVRGDVEEVIKGLKACRYNKKEYLQERSRRWDVLLEDAEVAIRFIYLNRTCFNGLYRVNAKGEFNVPFGKYTNPTICDEPILRAASAALKCAAFKIGDFEKTVKSAERGDLVYFDPPYVPVNETSNFTGYTRDGFTLADQERLRDCALKLKRRGVHVILSNVDMPIVRKIYRGFSIKHVEARRNINSKGGSRGPVGEVIIT
jgi:DNA adenine methylase